MKLRFTEPWLVAQSPISLAFPFDGIRLRFDAPWPNAVSPISLAFDKPPFNGITLRFDKPWLNAQSPLKLRFVDDGEPPVVVDTTIGIECAVVWRRPQQVATQVVLRESANAIGAEVDAAWQVLANTAINVVSRWSSKPSVGVAYAAPWSLKAATRNDVAINWSLPLSHQASVDLLWQSGEPINSDSVLRWLDVPAVQRETAVHWIDGHAVKTLLAMRYRGIVCEQSVFVNWGYHAPRWICSTNYRPPEPGLIKMRFSEPWANSASPLALRFTASEKYCYWDNGGGAIDANPSLPNLDFDIPIEPQIRRAYLMQPTLTCIRVSDSLPIVIDSVSISDSRRQYAQAVTIEFSCAIDASRAENELLLIDINGYQFYAIAEQPSKREAFGSASYSSSGRSRSAMLSSPWRAGVSYTNSVARSFAGILGDLLLNSGWTIELLGVTDFNVPAGAFSVSAASPIDAVSEAVSQIGCMLSADEQTQVLKVLPLWPVSPWAFNEAVADINVHDAVIISYDSKKEINPLCNGVWVRGEQQGVSRHVKRAGTAGDIAADDINAQLIVTEQAARLAGTNALADTGNKENITITLPLMADLPPLSPGMLIGVKYRDEVFKATCDSWSINASMDAASGLDVVQSVTLIRHLN